MPIDQGVQLSTLPGCSAGRRPSWTAGKTASTTPPNVPGKSYGGSSYVKISFRRDLWQDNPSMPGMIWRMGAQWWFAKLAMHEALHHWAWDQGIPSPHDDGVIDSWAAACMDPQ